MFWANSERAVSEEVRMVQRVANSSTYDPNCLSRAYALLAVEVQLSTARARPLRGQLSLSSLLSYPNCTLSILRAKLRC